MKTRYLLPLVFLLALAGGCSKDSSPAPAPTPTPTPTPTPPPITRLTIYGVVSNATTGQGVGSATVTAVNVLTQTNVTARSDGNGYYSLPGVGSGTVNLDWVASGYVSQAERNTFTGDTRRDIRLVPIVLWSLEGRGDTVFDMPRIARVRIQADYGGNSSNFIVKVAGRLLVNELVGRAWNQTHFDGTYLTTGGVTEITNSSGVSWSFAEVR